MPDHDAGAFEYGFTMTDLWIGGDKVLIVSGFHDEFSITQNVVPDEVELSGKLLSFWPRRGD